MTTAQLITIRANLHEQILALAVSHTAGHEFTQQVNNLYLFKHTTPSQCLICNKGHDSDNTLIVSVSKYKNIKLHCRLSQQFTGQKATLNIRHVNMPTNAVETVTPGSRLQPFDIKKYICRAKLNALLNEFLIIKYNNRKCQPLTFNNKFDTLLIKSPMGTDKTKALRNYIDNLKFGPIIIIVRFKHSFTTKIKTNFTRFVDYQDTKGLLDLQAIHA